MGLGIHDGGNSAKLGENPYPHPSSASLSRSKIPVCRRETLEVGFKKASTVTGSLIISVILSITRFYQMPMMMLVTVEEEGEEEDDNLL